jgi:phosphatidylserine decarboxylase
VFLGCRAHKIGIFMSLASVHVNRSPCAGRVEKVMHCPGRFLDARDPDSSTENESAAIAIADADGRGVTVLVRQVAGVLARRIVCAVAAGDRLECGQRIGMIKFGSRAEVYVPAGSGFEVMVAPGRRVRAGETILGRFR